MPTCEQIDNARRLADVLDKVAAEDPDHFDMRAYITLDEFDTIYKRSAQETAHLSGTHPAECGTAGCALGWAPYALGLKKARMEEWPDYGARAIGPEWDEPNWDNPPPDGGTWYAYLFGGHHVPAAGADAARNAAVRLREYADAFGSECD